MASKLLFSLAFACLFSNLDFAQNQSNDPTPGKGFGTSLNRLKWDPKKKIATEVGNGNPEKAEAGNVETIRVDANLITADVLITDKDDRIIRGLKQDDFSITEDGQPQQLVTFGLSNEPNRSRSIVLIVDYSRSQRPYLDRSIDAAEVLVNKLSAVDRMAVVTDDVALLINFTSDKAALKDALETLRNNARNGKTGKSAQYSALLATLRELVKASERPIIIFQTDGDEFEFLRPAQKELPDRFKFEIREFGIADVIRSVELSRSTVYTVIPGFRFFGLSARERNARAKADQIRHLEVDSAMWPRAGELLDHDKQIPDSAFQGAADHLLRDQQALVLLSRLAGGWSEFLEDPSQASDIYARILTGINGRYVLGYQSTNKLHDGQKRKVDIEVRGHPEYKVSANKVYYAPKD